MARKTELTIAVPELDAREHCSPNHDRAACAFCLRAATLLTFWEQCATDPVTGKVDSAVALLAAESIVVQLSRELNDITGLAHLAHVIAELAHVHGELAAQLPEVSTPIVVAGPSRVQ